MKATKYTIWLALAGTIVSCRQHQPGNDNLEAVSEKTVVSGYLPQLEDSAMFVYLTVWDNQNLLTPTSDYITQTENGHFTFELELKEVKKLSCMVDETRLWQNFHRNGTIPIAPGDSIHIEIPDMDHPEITSIEFSGKGHKKLELLKEITKRTQQLYEGVDVRNATLEQMMDLQIATKNMVESATAGIDQLSGALIRYHTFYNLYHSALQDLLRADPLAEETRRIYRDKYLVHFPLKKEMIDPRYIDVNIFVYIALRHVILEDAMVDGKAYNKNYRANPQKMYGQLKQEFQGNPLYSLALAGFISHIAKTDGWNDDVEKMAELYFDETTETDPYGLQIETLRKDMLVNLSVQSTARNFALPDTAGNIRTLEEFRGKVVLVDFMTYACAGCYKLVPRLQEIEHEFEGKDVAFISISADKTKEKFKKGIGKFSSPGAIALYTNGEGTGHAVIRHYGVQAYPTLVLIDKEGRIIEGRISGLSTVEGREKLKEMIREAL